VQVQDGHGAELLPPAVNGTAAAVAVGAGGGRDVSVGARQAAEPLALGGAREGEAAGEEVVRPAQSKLGDGGRRAPAQQAPPRGGGRAGRRGAVVVVVLEEQVEEEEGLLQQVRETPGGSAAVGGHWSQATVAGSGS
jgi:hypothetical protein